MLPLGHIGIGKWIADRVRPGLPLWPLVAGTLLPDLLDKPLYYGLSAFTGRSGASLGLISGSRTFGHSFGFLLLLTALAFGTRSRALFALAAGIATHLLLDNFLELFSALTVHSSRVALFFPLYGWRFPVATFETLGEHLLLHLRPSDILGEIAGLALIVREFRSRRRVT